MKQLIIYLIIVWAIVLSLMAYVANAAPTTTILLIPKIPGLASNGNPCLTVGNVASGGLVSTSTCGGGSNFATGTAQQVVVFNGTNTGVGYTNFLYDGANLIFPNVGNGTTTIGALGGFQTDAGLGISFNNPNGTLRANIYSTATDTLSFAGSGYGVNWDFSLLTTNRNQIVPNATGTIVLGTGTAGKCAEWSATNVLGAAAAACGTGLTTTTPWTLGDFAIASTTGSVTTISTTTARSTLGLGTAALQNSTAFLQVVNNLSDVNNASTSRGNLGLGNNNLVQFLGLTVNNGTSTNATTTVLAVTNSTNSLLLTDANGVVGKYAGTTACGTAAALTTISALGAGTCTPFLQNASITATLPVTWSTGNVIGWAGLTTSSVGLTGQLAIFSSATQLAPTSSYLRDVSGGGSTATGSILLGTGLKLSTQTISVSSTLATSSATFVFPDPTSTAPYSLISLYVPAALNLVNFKCWDYAATSTVNLYYNTTLASTSVGTNVRTDITCGINGVSTTTFTTAAIPIGAYLFAHVTSTAGAPTELHIYIDGTKT